MSGNDATADTTPASGSDKPEIMDIPLNEREKELYIIGMAYCNTAGPAKLDWDKFTKLGGFKASKTAQNTWSKIKGKLPEVKAAEDGKKQTPKKATPKKRAKKSEAEAEEDDEVREAEETPAKKSKKTPAKTPAKKGKAKAEVAPEVEGEVEEE